MRFFISILLTGLFFYFTTTFARDPRIDENLSDLYIDPTETVRGLIDNYGYATTEEQINEVLLQAKMEDRGFAEKLASENKWDENTRFIATIYPHDDYVYTARLNSLWIPYVKAQRIIIFGVFHKARWFGAKDALVFDSFNSWRGPFGEVPVSNLRESIITQMDDSEYIVDNDMHMIEHSIEAVIPLLQKNRPDVEIIPILVPYMQFETMETIANNLSNVLVKICKENNWVPGEDLAIMISTDAMHYGDSQFGPGANIDFGTDAEGYVKAVEREYNIINRYLTGDVKVQNLSNFLYACVERENLVNYKLEWCGRLSVPFGVLFADQFTEKYFGTGLEGTLLDYGTSVSEATLVLSHVNMGSHSVNNFHHWVGYPVIGYMRAQ